MKVALIRVGVDSSVGNGGIQGPLFEDGSFEFIPIPSFDVESKYTYGDFKGRHGRPLADYFPPKRRAAMAAQYVHNDPEWESFTYGDWTRPKSGLRHLAKGDILMFACGLQGWDFHSEPGIYLAGYFVVELADLAINFTQSELRRHFGSNDHVRGYTIGELDRIYDGKLILVKGSPRSRLLKRAVLLSTTTEDRLGRPLKVLSKRMQKIMGDFGGQVSIQRSPTRWISPQHVGKTVEFLRSLK